MKIPLVFRTLATLVPLVFVLNCPAQVSFDFSVTPSTNSVVQGGSLTYTINLTNRLADLGLLFVTNAFSQPVQFLANSNNFFASFTTNQTTGLFTFVNVPLSAILQMTLQVKPSAAGSLTNTVTAAANTTAIFPASTNVVTTVANPESDLAVQISAPSAGVLVNDPLNYSILVTNAGPFSAANVALTNILPAVKLLSVASTNPYTLSGELMLFNLGAMPAASSRTIGLTVQPTNTGDLILSARVGATNLVETNLVNNTATVHVSVIDFLPSQLSVSNVTAMVLDHQSGLMKQTVRLSNFGTNDAPSARVIVSGLGVWLFNAVGTNDASPYVVYASTLAAGQAVDLVLEYWIPSRQPITVPNSSYSAVAVPAVDPSAPGGGASSFSITTSAWLPDGNFLIEFEAVAGTSYTVLYSADPGFGTGVFAAQPPIVAPATRVQWIDDGPPKTTSKPMQTPARYYRIRQN